MVILDKDCVGNNSPALTLLLSEVYLVLYRMGSATLGSKYGICDGLAAPYDLKNLLIKLGWI
jgi:hypothetical protein